MTPKRESKIEKVSRNCRYKSRKRAKIGTPFDQNVLVRGARTLLLDKLDIELCGLQAFRSSLPP